MLTLVATNAKLNISMGAFVGEGINTHEGAVREKTPEPACRRRIA